MTLTPALSQGRGSPRVLDHKGHDRDSCRNGGDAPDPALDVPVMGELVRLAARTGDHGLRLLARVGEGGLGVERLAQRLLLAHGLDLGFGTAALRLHRLLLARHALQRGAGRLSIGASGELRVAFQPCLGGDALLERARGGFLRLPALAVQCLRADGGLRRDARTFGGPRFGLLAFACERERRGITLGTRALAFDRGLLRA